MGVEPTVAASVAPTTDFEDRGAHRDTSTPKSSGIIHDLIGQVKKNSVFLGFRVVVRREA